MTDIPPAPPPAATPRTMPATRRGVAAVAIVLAVAGTAGWLDARHNETLLRREFARELASASASASESAQRVSTLAAELRDAQAKLALLDTRQTEAQSQQAA